MSKVALKRIFLLALAVFAAGGAGFVLSIRYGKPDKSVFSAPVLSGDPAAAAARHARAAEIDARFKQGVAMLRAKKYDYAITALHRVLELAPGMPEAHVNMGFAMIGLERYGMARDFFESAIDLRPAQINAYYGLAEALAGLNDLEGALGAMRSYIHRSAPGDPYVGKAGAAIEKWEKYLQRKPGSDFPKKEK